LQAEPRTNLVLGLVLSLRAALPANQSRPWLLSIHDGDSLIGCAIRTPPRDLIITQMERPGVEALIRSLRAELPSLPGVIGPEPTSGEFAGQWSNLQKRPSQVRMRQRFYVLHRVRADLPAVPGCLRLAASSDLALVAEWVAQFTEEVATDDSHDPKEAAGRAIARGQLYLWQSSRPVSMAAWTGATPNGRRVGYVFTPPAERRHGYAAACVASLSRKILSLGDSYCCLYADRANPTSNAIYARIGYEPLYDVTQFTLAGSSLDPKEGLS